MCNLSLHKLPMIPDQQSLTLRSHSFSWWGREGIAIYFAYKGRQKFLCDWLQPIGGVISPDAWPKIVDAPLTFIFMMGQGGYCSLFSLERQPKKFLSLNTTYRRCYFPGRMTNNRWRSVDAHFAMAVSTICYQLFWHSPSFTLFWLPFWHFHLLSSWSLLCSLMIHTWI